MLFEGLRLEEGLGPLPESIPWSQIWPSVVEGEGCGTRALAGLVGIFGDGMKGMLENRAILVY